ncbi:MAG: hypothetical protein K2F59_04210 [Eubacteriales bacterium]|nr:hypothetical protein [Eubacteriales bacterium]
MLDLREYKKENFYELTWFDGQVLKIDVLKQGDLKKVSSISTNTNDENMVDNLLELVSLILNNNKNNIKFSEQEILEQLDIEMMNTIIVGYVQFLANVLGK